MRTYTQEEKQAVIDRVISGEPSASILADTGIPKVHFMAGCVLTVTNWKRANERRSMSAIFICSKTKSHAWKASLKF